MISNRLYKYKAVVTRVIDGDTVEAEVDLGFRVVLAVTVRLYGIDTPEVRGPSRDAGLRSKARLKDLVEGKELLLDSQELDKYGRSLGVLHLGEINVNELLVSEGLAVPYMV